MDWLDAAHDRQAVKLLQEYPVIEPGMFVQLDSWFGDVWAEITSVSMLDFFKNSPRYHSVDFFRYEKYGRSRKLDHASFGYIRKFARREDIPAGCIVYTPTLYTSPGRPTVEWPEGVRYRQDMGRYELHPTHPSLN